MISIETFGMTYREATKPITPNNDPTLSIGFQARSLVWL